MATKTIAPISPKQLNFVRKLVGERILTGITMPDKKIEALSMSEARTLIDQLLLAPHLPTAQATPGYYTVEDTDLGETDVYVVVENKAGTSTYAKKLLVYKTKDGKKRGKWGYAPGVAATLATFTPLTVAEAARLSHLHGCCVVCGRTLEKKESVEAGIGPVCAGKLNH